MWAKRLRQPGKQRKRDISEPKIQFRSYDFPDVSRFTLGMVRSGSFRLFLFFFQVLHFFFCWFLVGVWPLICTTKEKNEIQSKPEKKV